ncbi:MAG: glycine cleavage system protein H [Flammeovirgaceae bacterium]|mgnify:FL=1|nr:glycine cleavage system protein H [Flammeovirgaceae bacterium]|tara:strand:+ start:4692 stop:5066 length:375 start_codon:yes stop_codon:yes gene_type:complete
MDQKELKFTQDHEWMRVDGEHAFIGITDFAQGELGDIVYVEIETLDESVGMGNVFGTIEAVKTVSDLFMPVDGVIVEVNEKLESEPELVNNDPYGEGWMVKIKLDNPTQVNELLDLTAYEKITG